MAWFNPHPREQQTVPGHGCQNVVTNGVKTGANPGSNEDQSVVGTIAVGSLAAGASSLPKGTASLTLTAPRTQDAA
jgi:hypothetical protein